MASDTYLVQAISLQALTVINFIVWSQDLKSLSSKVSQRVTQYGANKVGIYLVTFDEVAPIFIGTQNQSRDFCIVKENKCLADIIHVSCKLY